MVLLFSTQIDSAIAERYTRAQWLLLRGSRTGNPTHSTYAFCRDVLGYDLAAFFERNSRTIKREVETIITDLLK